MKKDNIIVQKLNGDMSIMSTPEDNKVASRIRNLREMAFNTLCGKYVPEGMRRRHDVYYQSKENIRLIAETGGEEYEKVMKHLQWYWENPDDCAAAKIMLNGKAPEKETVKA
jgi:hypothetical protein